MRSSSDNASLLKNVMSRHDIDELMPEVPVTREFKTVTLKRSVVTAQDQAESGRCWIFSAINVLRREIIRKKKLPPVFNLSHAYVYFYSLYEKCNAVLEKVYYINNQQMSLDTFQFRFNSGISLDDGGYYITFCKLLRKYGIVPIEVFPDNFQATHSKSLKKILTIILKQTALEIYKTKGKNKEILVEKAMSKVHTTLCTFLGTPPDSFNYVWPTATGSAQFENTYTGGGGGITTKTFSPLQFFKKNVETHLDDKNSIELKQDPRKKYNTWICPFNTEEMLPNDIDVSNLRDFIYQVSFNVKNISDIKEAILKSLHGKRAVQITCDIENFFNRRLNLMAREASTIPRLFDVDIWNMTKKELLESTLIHDNHIMTVIGYDAATDYWEVENSWGNLSPIAMSGVWFDRLLFVKCSRAKKNICKKLRSAIETISVPGKPNADKWSLI